MFFFLPFFLFLFFSFFFLARCVSPLDLPLCRPPWFIFHRHLKRSKTLPSPMPFSLFPLFLSLPPWAQTPSAGLSQPAVLVSNRGTRTQQREGMKLMWNLHSQRLSDDPLSVFLSSPGGQRGRWDEPAQVLLWVLMGGSTRWHPQGGKHTSSTRGNDKGGGPLCLHYFHWWEKKRREGETCACSHSSSSSSSLCCPAIFPPFPTPLYSTQTHSFLPHPLFSVQWLHFCEKDDASLWLAEGFLAWNLIGLTVSFMVWLIMHSWTVC